MKAGRQAFSRTSDPVGGIGLSDCRRSNDPPTP